jgi:glycosyltransferase involved in cell wall biosynthesis
MERTVPDSAPPHPTNDLAPLPILAGEQEHTPYISIVVPIYNEEESIETLHARLTENLELPGHPYEIIAVDDGSKDGSFAILRRLAQADPRLHVVRFRRNFGQTAAFSAGFDRARGKVIFTIDADLQNDPADIPALLAKIEEGYDVVSGWRAQRKDPYWSRRVPSMIANGIISTFTSVHLHDYGCSLKAYRADVLKNIQLYGELHRFIPAVASWQGVTVTEIPVRHHPRQYGKSKYGINRTIRVIIDLLTVRFLLSYSTRPMQIFGLWGLLSMLLGIVINLYLVTLKLLTGEELSTRPLLLLGILLIIVGAQFISLGLIGELVVRTYYETQNKRIYAVREEVNAAGGPPTPEETTG